MPSAKSPLRISSIIEDILYGRRRAGGIGPVLIILAWLYHVIVLFRLFIYRISLLTTRELPCRIISVGNITLGGTGKTPTVIQIARMLQEQGRRVAVLSRGYGRRNESDVLIVSDGAVVENDASAAGDEPVLIASRLPGVAVVAGADRYKAGRTVIDAFGPDVIVLDDGFQHVRLKRDLNIALIDATDPFGNGRLFPAGILREPPGSLSRADVVLITRADRGRDLDSLRNVIRRHTRAQVFTASHVPACVKDIMTGSESPLSLLRGTALLAFCGIARPEAFFSLLKELGGNMSAELSFPDHYQYDAADLERIRRMARETKVGMIITTEKDAVRLRGMDCSSIRSLVIEQKVRESDAWQAVITNKV